MSVQVPIIRCSLLLELYNSRNQVTKKENFKLVDVSLARNEFKEIMLEITFLGKETKKKTTPLKYDSLNLFRKFVKEGKLTISFTGDSQKKYFLQEHFSMHSRYSIIFQKHFKQMEEYITGKIRQYV